MTTLRRSGRTGGSAKSEVRMGIHQSGFTATPTLLTSTRDASTHIGRACRALKGNGPGSTDGTQGPHPWQARPTARAERDPPRALPSRSSTGREPAARDSRSHAKEQWRYEGRQATTDVDYRRGRVRRHHVGRVGGFGPVLRVAPPPHLRLDPRANRRGRRRHRDDVFADRAALYRSWSSSSRRQTLPPP